MIDYGKNMDGYCLGELFILAKSGQKDAQSNKPADKGDGIGKPEPLRGDLSGWWARRIDDTNRLVYRIENGKIIIADCRSHYGDK